MRSWPGIFRAAFIAYAALLAFGVQAQAADSYPSRTITLVVPFPPGGGTDIAARLLAEKMSGSLKQRVIVVNRAGAAGNLGSDFVAKSDPDGYTLVMATQGTHASNASLFKVMPYDTIKDFAPISLVASTPLILVINADSPEKNLKDFIATAKSKPGALNFGSSSVGGSPHLAMELLDNSVGMKMVHVPYQGSAPARIALLAGEISIMFDNIPSSLPLVRSGKFRALGVSGASRSPAAPDIPTVAEAGVPGFEMTAWYGLLAPAKTPASIIQILNKSVSAALHQPDVTAKLIDLGYDPVGTTPESFAEQIGKDMSLYANLMKAAGITPQ